MKKHGLSIITFLLGIILLISFELIGSELSPEGILIEPFWMLPIGYLLISISIVLNIYRFFSKKK